MHGILSPYFWNLTIQTCTVWFSFQFVLIIQFLILFFFFFLICFSSLHFLVVMLTLVKFNNNNIFVLIADQVASESNIPLSPQWLYAKPADAKALTAGILGVQKFTLVLSFCFFFPFVQLQEWLLLFFHVMMRPVMSYVKWALWYVNNRNDDSLFPYYDNLP